MSIRRLINVEISTTVEISTLFRLPLKYAYVFFDGDSTLNQRQNCPLDGLEIRQEVT